MNNRIGTRIVTALGCVAAIVIAPMSRMHAQAMGGDPRDRGTYLTTGEMEDECFKERILEGYGSPRAKIDPQYLAGIRQSCANRFTHLTISEQHNACFREQLRGSGKYLGQALDFHFLDDVRRRCAGKD